jgi:hypothetical protein
VTRTGRRGSWGWWAVLSCACVAMGVYLSFEVPDLDGSNLRSPLPDSAIAAKSAFADVQRSLHPAPSPGGALGFALRPPALRFDFEPSQGVPRLSEPAIVARRVYLRPRTDMSREAASATSRGEDPA